MRKIKILSWILAFGLCSILLPNILQAQICGPTGSCQTDADCFDINLGPPCPSCFRCLPDPISGTFNTCQPVDDACDDGTMCTTGICNDNIQFGPLGCMYSSDALDPNFMGDLDVECYMCEPTENGVAVDNGICDQAIGENCDNSVDCRTDPSQGCITPPADPNPNFCGNPEFGPVLCTDNDRCTVDSCEVIAGTTVITQCVNTPIDTCSPVADGCCPAGCTGPVPGDPNGCRDVTGAPIPGCDPDCWAPQSCGDGQVQPPETCDDAANVGDAGLAPDGSAISDAQCRDPGTAGECTACGDGIIQAAAGEECDGADATACGTGGICNAPGTLGECTCAVLPPPVTNICVTGSGDPFDTIRTNCGNCALNPHAESKGPLQNYVTLILLALGLGVAFTWRRRKA